MLSEFEAVIAGRRSIRRYRADPVPHDVLEGLIEAACWAPSAHNRQPWRFAVLGAAARERLADAMGNKLAADRAADGDPAEAIAADVARSRARITGAPAAILASYSLRDMDRYPDARRAAAERDLALQGTAAAIQNLLLAASARGLGASWMCAPLFCGEVVRAALALPDDWEPQALITLGWPANNGRPATREPVATRTLWIQGDEGRTNDERRRTKDEG